MKLHLTKKKIICLQGSPNTGKSYTIIKLWKCLTPYLQRATTSKSLNCLKMKQSLLSSFLEVRYLFCFITSDDSKKPMLLQAGRMKEMEIRFLFQEWMGNCACFLQSGERDIIFWIIAVQLTRQTVK